MTISPLWNTRATLAEYSEPPSVAQVQSVLSGAWKDEQNLIGQNAVLNPYRLTIEQFVRTGREHLGPEKFAELANRLEMESRIKCQLLACGFSRNGIPSLLACEDEFLCRDFTRADFVAIGTGHTVALANLAFHEYTRMADLESAIYQVCAAKFMAERAPGVGRHTLVLCMRDDGKKKWIFKTHVQQIRDLWEGHGRPRIPAQSHLDSVIAPITEHQAWSD